jgi:uncharacterized membrane protein
MSERSNAQRETATILWAAAMFIAGAIIGYALAPSALIIWAVLLFFGITAVPQAYLRQREARRTRGRHR